MAPFIALRYLISSRSSRYMNWMTLLSIMGISIGIAAMIVVLSVINGFEKELRERFLPANAHVLAFQYPSGIEDPKAWINTMQKDFGQDISGISPFIHSETMVTKDGLMHNILIKGIDPYLREKVQSLDSVLRPLGAIQQLKESFDGKSPQNLPPPIILGSGLLSILQAKVGETIKLVAPEGNQLGELREFRVVGIYDSGLKHYDNKLGIVSIKDAQQFFKMKSRVHGLEIGLKNPNASTTIAGMMSEKYSLTIKEWQSFNKAMFEAMKMERAVIALIVALVAFVASFNILTTLFITVTQKQRSISVLKALGASNKQIQSIFISQGFFIGVIGAILGMGFALIFSRFLQKVEVINLPEVYMLAKLPVEYEPSVYFVVALSGCLVCVLAGAYPAWTASRINVVEGLRNKNA